MSFFSDIIDPFRTDLATALSLDVAHIYAGRTLRRIPATSCELMIERLNAEPVQGGFQQVWKHPFRLHIRHVSKRVTLQERTAQITAMDLLMQAAVNRYHGTRRLSGTVSGIEAITATEEQVDSAEGDMLELIGTVLVTFFVGS